MESLYDEEDVVVLTDDDGEVEEYVFVALIEVEGLEYAIMALKEELDNRVEDPELFLFEYSEDEDGEEVYSDIEDEELFEKVRQEADRVLQSE